MNQIFIRRSVRSFLDKPVEESKIDKLLRAGMQAPSARNQKGCKLAVITDKSMLDELSKFKPVAKPISLAPLAIVVLGDIENMVVPFMMQQDLSCVAQNIMLEAVSQDLGSVWIGVCPNEDWIDSVTEITKLDKSLVPLAVLAIGYPTDKDANKFIDKFDESKIIRL